MSNSLLLVLGSVGALIVGIAVGFIMRKKTAESGVNAAANEAQKIRKDAEKEAENIKKNAELEAKDLLYQTKSQFEAESKERRKDLQKLENRLMQKEENLEKKSDAIE